MTIANEKTIDQTCLFLDDFYSDANKTCVIRSLISVEVICKVWFYFLEVRVKTKQLNMTIHEKHKNFHFIKKSQSVKGLKGHVIGVQAWVQLQFVNYNYSFNYNQFRILLSITITIT